MEKYSYLKHLLFLITGTFGIFTILTLLTLFEFPKANYYDIKYNGDINHKIIFISDLHVGTYMPKWKVQKIFKTINEQNPDTIILGGDILEPNQNVFWMGKELTKLNAKNKIAILGNHDLRNITISERIIETGGFTILNGDISSLSKDIDIIGFDFDNEEYKKQQNKNAFNILVTHSPDVLSEIVKDNDYDLSLHGHIHGGQIKLFGKTFFTNSRYGNYWLEHDEYKGHNVIVSNGVGTTFLPIRIGAPPEFEVINLIPDK